MPISLPWMEIYYSVAGLAHVVASIRHALEIRKETRREVSPAELRRVVDDAREVARATREAAEPEGTQGDVALSGHIEDAVDQQIRKAERDLDKQLGEHGSDFDDWNKALGHCQKTICDVLRILKQFNGNTLPPNYEALWKQHACTS